MPSSTQAINENISSSINATTFSATSSVEDVSILINELKTHYKNFEKNAEFAYEKQKDILLARLNSILGKTYSFNTITGNLPIETIFDECTLNIECSAGKKAYVYYLKEVLQKLNQLNQHIIKGQEAFNALASCTTESQIKNFQTTLEMQSKFVENSLYEFSKYTVIQTLETTRQTLRKSLNEEMITSSTNSIETNYEIKQKNILNDDFKSIVPDTLAGLRTLKTTKESGNQSIITILTNSKTNAITDLNDKWGVNVITKNTSISTTNSSPIALFDELTLLDKLKYIIVYYKDTSSAHYFYPNDAKSGVPCMSKDALKTYITDNEEDVDTTNKNELQALGIIPSDENAPKTDDIEVGAIELFYTGYLEDSMGAINALAKFMELKSVALMAQITQQSYRIKALKAYLSMLEFGFQALNNSYTGEIISSKVYLALKYAAANQTRTLINIDGTDYIVVQLDGTTKDNHQLSNNNRYIFVKATPEGINAFLEQGYKNIDQYFSAPLIIPTEDFIIEKLKTLNKSFSLPDPTTTTTFNALDSDNEDENKDGVQFSTNFSEWTIKFSEKAEGTSESPSEKLLNAREIGDDPEEETTTPIFPLIQQTVTTKTQYFRSQNQNQFIIATTTNKTNQINNFINQTETHYDYYYYDYSKKPLSAGNNNFFFVTIDNNDKAINFLPKELETVKININSLINFRNGGLAWDDDTPNKDINKDTIWPELVNMWQSTCQTAIENVGSQIESVNKTIKSLRSKVDTFDSSSSRFRDKFYTTTMTIINKIS